MRRREPPRIDATEDGAEPAQARRVYESPLRQEQMAATRERIIEGVIAEATCATEPLSVPAVARRAGVSIPTVYRYFPTRAALFAAAIDHIDATVPLRPVDLDPFDFEPWVRAFFEHRAAVEEKLGPLCELGPIAWEGRREVTVPRRRAFVDLLLARWAPGLVEPERTCVADNLVVLLSSETARSYRGYLGCTPQEAAERLCWVLRAVQERAQRSASGVARESRGSSG